MHGMGNTTHALASDPLQPSRFLRPKMVTAFLGISATTLWRLAKTDPRFPAAYQLGKNSIAFREDQLLVWIAGRQR